MPRKLGQAFQTAVISPAGRTNAGNWTATFDSPDIGIFLPEFDCYHIVIKGGPAGSTFDIYVNNNLYDSVTPGDTNSWDPNHPMKLSNGDSVIFYWNAGTGTAPTVWLYFQEPELL